MKQRNSRANRQPNYGHILVAIDDFQASEPLLQFVGEIAAGREGSCVHLFHAVGPMPPQYLESPGAEDPVEEEKIEAKQEREQRAWFASARKKSAPLFKRVKGQLVKANLPRERIETHLLLLNHRKDLVAEILKAAQTHDCGMVVVGKSSYPWILELFHSHVGEQLISASEALAVCVVDEPALSH